ncbi:MULTISPECIES: protein-glutamate methylesterase/protein-glutamine glutaminase [Acetobacterium]|uniref:Protein-glutamate methylesterase/protein-glutamine glutaminase n=1 Tax=Acetobacterium wieringae TaxID=52694 RepID=A0A1F2PG13_9FIRM|nr:MULTISPECIES: chemotaxis response regulator protein-glutamate methylesterase [Acetobacterium]OFV70005.1 chemotaxis response regulator protein-glutamate methylesterase [Acetobacterium wieringae]OXS25096.1 MAG: chemotaxis response regulator protein-glutamate methylesterase [Acetobacterium sp. MES1]
MRLKQRIKVLIVDDSLVFRESLSREISKDPDIEVVGTATDPYMARDLIIKLKPDVLTLDVEMPKMNGIEFLKKLMPQYPLPVIVVSSVSKNVLDALDAGAVEFVTKPNVTRPGGMASFVNELIIKIKIASTAKVGNRKSDYTPSRTVTNQGIDTMSKIIAIGASTGGTDAIHTVISSLPRDMPPIIIVQHMPPVFTKLYAERLNNTCELEVKEAEDGDALRPGRVLIAPGNFQMRLAKRGTGYIVKCTQEEKVSGHCPSVDVLFDSVAAVAGRQSVGVILTGMGRDGANGLLKMKKTGAYTIGQDEKSSVVYGMPMVAYNIGAVDKQLPLDRIADEIIRFLSK